MVLNTGYDPTLQSFTRSLHSIYDYRCVPCHTHLIFLDITRPILSEWYKLWNFFFMQFLQSFVTSCFVGSNIIFSTWFPNLFKICSSRRTSDTCWHTHTYTHTHTDTHKTIVLHFISNCFWRCCCITAIYYLNFIHRPYVLQPQRFKGWLFPRHQVNLLCWVRSIELASIGGHWVLSHIL
jgi:hypothetical protein